MLTIAKLGVGQQNYYLSKVASGIEDYYSGRGEAPGVWMGRGAARLNLAGRVRPGQLGRLMGGRGPATGVRLAGRDGVERVPGWDLTFSAPKSVSVLWGLGTPKTAAQIAAAHDAAVAAGIAYMERHAVCSRRRVDGDVTTIRAEGLVIAAFRHRTSRAGDPQLHTHALAPNLVEFVDGGWGAIHSPVIYRYSRTAGFVYQAVLRGELTERLGVEWGEVRNGCAEIVGVGAGLLDLFSKRRSEITAAMAVRGQHSARAAQIAAHTTRAAKDYGVDPDALRQRWATDARAAGVDPASLHEVFGHPAPPVTADHLQQAIAAMLSPHGLTHHDASFDQRDIMRAWCEALPPGTRARLDDLEALCQDLLTHPDVVQINDGLGRLAGHEVLYRADGTPTTASHAEPRWSTAEILAVEKQLLDTADTARTAGAGRVPSAIIERHLDSRGDLSDEQAAMVRQITTSGAGVEVVVGRAGTGKTYALAAAADIWRSAGFQVLGLGLAARAAKQLEASAAIPSTTVARFLIDADQAAPGFIHHRHVIVVDEAGMVDTRRLARVVAIGHHTGAKVLLVGDHHQLPAVESGGAFAALATRLGAVELVQNRRQVEAWEQDLLDHLRTSPSRAAIGEILAVYGEHGRLHAAGTPALVQQAMIQDWYAARTGSGTVGMIALRRRDVAELNTRARALLVADGTVAATGVQIGPTSFATGDRVVCTRGDRNLGVHNALFATIAHTDPDTGTVVIQPDNRPHRPLALPRWYLAKGQLRHAYATTIHKAQGATYDHALIYGDERLYRQAGYTGLSRGRQRNDLYIVEIDTQAQESDLEQHGDPPYDDTWERIIRALNRDAAKTLATTERDEAEQWGPTQPLPGLWAERDQLLKRCAADSSQPVAQADVHHDGSHELSIARLAEINDTIRYRSQLAGRVAEVERPDHITALLGEPPVDVDARQRWRQAAAAIESYRARWGTQPEEPFTNMPNDAGQHRHLTHVLDTIDTAIATEDIRAPDDDAAPAVVELA